MQTLYSRLPLPEAPETVPLPSELVLLLEHLLDYPFIANHIQCWTRNDSVLSRVLEFVRRGWPEEVQAELKPFFSRKEELSELKGCLLLGSRVVVPNAGREAILTQLHVSLVPRPHPLREKGLVNLGRILGTSAEEFPRANQFAE